ncbi:MAG: iron ABC transporter permease [Bacteroidales bacterium]|nr:iron ABC transporter permease [Bacteroidales bacterium]
MKRFGPILCLALILLAGLDLLTGNGFGPVGGVILWNLRLPRMLTAVIAGASLALAGMQMQALFRNPLADPHIMGVSGGAGLGAAIVALALGTSAAWFSGMSMALAAFAGAFLTSLLIVVLSTRLRATTLLILGVMLGFVFSALSSILQYSAGEESLKLFYSWMAGSFSGTRTLELIIMAAALLAGLALAVWNRKGLDIILFGENYASFSGAPLKRIRTLSMLSASLMTGIVTAFCGPLGFVGIVAPHLSRKLTGSSAHGKVLPTTLATGACLALVADILANLWPVPLPAGSTLALIGIPLIIWYLCHASEH